MLRSVCKRASKWRLAQARLYLRSSNAMMSDSTFSRKEAAEEARYFNEQDREHMKRLLKKLHSQDAESAHAEELDPLFKKHGVELSEKLKEDLVSWKTRQS